MWKWVTESTTKPSLSFCFFFSLSFLFKDCLCLHDLQGNWKCTRWSSKAQNLHKYVCFIFASSELFWEKKKKGRQKKERIWWVKNSLLCFTSDNILAYICTSLSWCHWRPTQGKWDPAMHSTQQKHPQEEIFFWAFNIDTLKNRRHILKDHFYGQNFSRSFMSMYGTRALKKSFRFNFGD